MLYCYLNSGSCQAIRVTSSTQLFPSTEFYIKVEKIPPQIVRYFCFLLEVEKKVIRKGRGKENYTIRKYKKKKKYGGQMQHTQLYANIQIYIQKHKTL